MPKIFGVELKNCPFCGATNVNAEQWPTGNYSIVCFSCGASGPDDLGKSGAAERWNERNSEESIDTIVSAE